MTSEFIANIIRLKLTESDEINREDILNILAMQSKNMYQDIEEYQKLINDTIIEYFTYNSNGHNFTNLKVLQIFESLAASYKVSEDFDIWAILRYTISTFEVFQPTSDFC